MSDQTGNEPNQGDMAQEILNKIVTDADFRQQLLDNPAETLAKAGYTSGDDVSGYSVMARPMAAALGKVDSVEGIQPGLTGGVDCVGGGGGATTWINCGGGGGQTGPVAAPGTKPKHTPTNS